VKEGGEGEGEGREEQGRSVPFLRSVVLVFDLQIRCHCHCDRSAQRKETKGDSLESGPISSIPLATDRGFKMGNRDDEYDYLFKGRKIGREKEKENKRGQVYVPFATLFSDVCRRKLILRETVKLKDIAPSGSSGRGRDWKKTGQC
jgi:hypothetical protein